MNESNVSSWNVRLLSFLVPSFIGGLLFWFFVQQALRGHVAFNQVALVNVALFLLLGVIFLALWLSPCLLVPYVGRWRSVRWISVAIAVVPILFFFPLVLWTAVSIVVLAICFVSALEAIFDDSRNRITVQPMHSLPRGITYVIFGVILAISLLYYQQLRGSADTADALSTKFIDQTVTLTERILPVAYKSYRPGITIDELIGAQIPTADSILKEINFSTLSSQNAQQQALQQKLESLGLDASAVNINVQQNEAAVKQQIDLKLNEYRAQTVDQARQELAQRLGISLKGTDTVHDALTRVIGKQFDTYVRRWVTFMPALLALALFFVLRFFTSLLQAIVVWGGWLFLRLLRTLKVIGISHQTVPAETVMWG